MTAFVVGATFETYAAFNAAFKQYCKENSLHFLQQNTRKLNSSDFQKDANIVYQYVAFICKFHKSKDKSGKYGSHCDGRVVVSYDQENEVLSLKKVSEHTNHPDGSTHDLHLLERSNQLHHIFEVIKKLPDEALGPLRTACEFISDKWGVANQGLMINIVPVDGALDGIDPPSDYDENPALANTIVKSEPLDDDTLMNPVSFMQAAMIEGADALNDQRVNDQSEILVQTNTVTVKEEVSTETNEVVLPFADANNNEDLVEMNNSFSVADTPEVQLRNPEMTGQKRKTSKDHGSKSKRRQSYIL